MADGNFNMVGLTFYMGLLGLLPLLVVSLTGFLKISVVLFLIRNALGIQQTPPNLVLYGIALVLTIYVSTPLIGSIAERYNGHQLEFNSPEAIKTSMGLLRQPLQAHLEHFTQPEERQFFLSATTQIWPASARVDVKNDDLIVMLPAFVSSELTRAFEIGFLLYLPFLVVDLIVSTVLMAMGMSMVQPTLISVPLKLLLFVAVAGWSRLMHGLILTYG
jgi:type III secretion protein R